MSLRKLRVKTTRRTKDQLNQLAAELAGLMENGQLCLAYEERVGSKNIAHLEMVSSIAINGEALQIASFIVKEKKK
jgi:hypothetical protein